jgi:hypothetical protein
MLWAPDGFGSALAGAAAQTQEPRAIAAPTSILVITLAAVVDETVVVVMDSDSRRERSTSSVLTPVPRPRHPDCGNTGQLQLR